MVLSISDALTSESFFKFSVGIANCTVTPTQLTSLQSLVSSDLANFIGLRPIIGDLKTRIEACLILDKWFLRGGKGTVVRESVTDSSWSVNIKTSSPYMDTAVRLRDNMDSFVPELDLEGVFRNDSEVSSATLSEFDDFF